MTLITSKIVCNCCGREKDRVEYRNKAIKSRRYHGNNIVCKSCTKTIGFYPIGRLTDNQRNRCRDIGFKLNDIMFAHYIYTLKHIVKYDTIVK